MKTRFFFRAAALALGGYTLFFSSACSKSTAQGAGTPSSSSPTATASASPTISPRPSGSPFADADLRLRDLEKQMDDIFANTFRDFGSALGQSGVGLSIDLREQKDRYIARVYVPNGDTANVNARVENGALHVTAQSSQSKNGTSTAESSDEIVSLSQPVKADQMKIDRKQNMVVITIPKATTATAAVSPTPSATASPSPAIASSDWDNRMLTEMERMQTRMDEMFRNAFPNDLLDGTSMVRLGSTVKVDDQGDKYVVHFTLPRSDMSNANVKFADGRLSLTLKEEKSNTSNASPGTMSTTESGNYEQMITLPGPVKDAEMKVERKNGAVVVTLPKA